MSSCKSLPYILLFLNFLAVPTVGWGWGGTAQIKVSAPNTLPPKVRLQTALDRAAEVIRAHQLPDGAIVLGERAPYRLSPYVANYAALGLLSAYSVDSKQPYLAAVRGWIEWYVAHLNGDGTIYDYSGAPGNWKTTEDYDSTDSYAATFLELLASYYRATKGADWLPRLKTLLPKIVHAMCVTQQANSLTLAKPKYPVMYTMDNVEVYNGWRAAAELARALGFKKQAADYAASGAKVLRAIYAFLWTKVGEVGHDHFLLGMQQNGKPVEVQEPMRWYPDQMAQLLAIAWLPKCAQTKGLYSWLQKSYLEIPSGDLSGPQVEPLVWWALAAERMEDKRTLHLLLNRLAGIDYRVMPIEDGGLCGHICAIFADALRNG